MGLGAANRKPSWRVGFDAGEALSHPGVSSFHERAVPARDGHIFFLYSMTKKGGTTEIASVPSRAEVFLFPEKAEKMYYPELEEVKKLKKQGNLVPIYHEIVADLETPVSAYLKIAQGDYSFLLESVEGGERLARYSFIGTEPSLVIKTGRENPVDPLTLIEKEFQHYRPVPVSGLPRFHGGIVGYLSYEVARYFEKLPAPDNDPQGLPESVLMLADTLLVFDHLTHRIKIVSHAHLDGDIEQAYSEATGKIDRMVARLKQPVNTDAPPSAVPESPVTSNLSPPGPRTIFLRETSFRPSCHSACPNLPAPVLLPSTAPCARLTPLPICTSCILATAISWALLRSCWSGWRTASSPTTPSPAPVPEALTPTATWSWPESC